MGLNELSSHETNALGDNLLHLRILVFHFKENSKRKLVESELVLHYPRTEIVVVVEVG